jgi:hypothetical protein
LTVTARTGSFVSLAYEMEALYDWILDDERCQTCGRPIHESTDSPNPKVAVMPRFGQAWHESCLAFDLRGEPEFWDEVQVPEEMTAELVAEHRRKIIEREGLNVS